MLACCGVPSAGNDDEFTTDSVRAPAPFTNIPRHVADGCSSSAQGSSSESESETAADRAEPGARVPLSQQIAACHRRWQWELPEKGCAHSPLQTEPAAAVNSRARELRLRRLGRGQGGVTSDAASLTGDDHRVLQLRGRSAAPRPSAGAGAGAGTPQLKSCSTK